MLKRCLLKFLCWHLKSSSRFSSHLRRLFHCCYDRHLLPFTFLVLFFSLSTVSIIHCVKPLANPPQLQLSLAVGHSLYMQSFKFVSQHIDSAIFSKSVHPMSQRQCSISTRKHWFSCTLQRQVFLSALDGWTTQKGCIGEDKVYEIP